MSRASHGVLPLGPEGGWEGWGPEHPGPGQGHCQVPAACFAVMDPGPVLAGAEPLCILCKKHPVSLSSPTNTINGLGESSEVCFFWRGIVGDGVAWDRGAHESG